MIYFLYGEDLDKARQNLHKIVDGLKAKKPDAEVFRMDSENWNSVQFEELVSAQGLFESKYIVILFCVFENKEIKEFVMDRLALLNKSESIFVIVEKKIDKVSLSKIEKKSTKTQEFVFKEGSSGSSSVEIKSLVVSDFNIFNLADAMGKRDKKALWVMYQKAVSQDLSAEEIHGLLFWQVKSMLLAIQSKTAEESGLKPFVFSKSKSFALNFTKTELGKISADLVSMYHDAHRGLIDFDTSLEKWILAF
jgi:DNA polymerase III delta subunit